MEPLYETVGGGAMVARIRLVAEGSSTPLLMACPPSAGHPGRRGGPLDLGMLVPGGADNVRPEVCVAGMRTGEDCL